MILFLYILSAIWTIAGVLIMRGAWNERASDYEEVKGTVAQPLALSYEEHEKILEPRVVMAKIRLEDDPREYRLRGKLYNMDPAGMESIQAGDTLRLMVKKTSLVGGYTLERDAKSAPVSGIYRSNGEVIIPLEKGIAHARTRLLIGGVFTAVGLILGLWVYFKNA
jgi:hypothetical protein